ncbi:MAG: response regulator [Acidobacteria bacterium]|nr:response regulator [Acidobacteriota bacterium]
MAGKVLIADDSLKVQKELTALLKGAGIEAVTVSNGEHAVRKMASVQPDLVLADIFMPVRDGYEVCDFVKSSGEFPHTRVVLLVSKMEPYDDKRAKIVRADGKIEKPFSDDPGAVLATVKQHLDKVLAGKPAPAAAPIDEFAAAVPEEAEAAAAPEPEVFTTRPAPVSFENQDAGMGFTDMAAELPATPPAPPLGFQSASVSEVCASEEEVVDLNQATMLTSADELQRRMVEESPEGAVVEEAVAEADVVTTTRPHAPPEPARPAPPADEGTVILTRLEKPPGAEVREVEKPVLAEAWEMTGPQEGAPPVPVVGGFDSQWSSSPSEEAAVEEAPVEAPPVEEAPPPPAEAPAEQPYAAEEFAAAMSAALADQPPTPPEPEAPAMVTPTPMADAYAAPLEDPERSRRAAMMPGVDPGLVDEVVNRVMERLTPQVMDTIAREVVRPLAESLLREKLRQ